MNSSMCVLALQVPLVKQILKQIVLEHVNLIPHQHLFVYKGREFHVL